MQKSLHELEIFFIEKKMSRLTYLEFFMNLLYWAKKVKPESFLFMWRNCTIKKKITKI